MSGGRKSAFALVRAAVGIGLLAWLLAQVDAASMLRALAAASWAWIGVAALFQAIAKLVWADRWRCILRAVDVDLPFGELLALVFVGLFFNNFLPTSVGGDLVRGWYTGRGEGGRARAMSVVLVERLLGLITLAATAAVAGAVLLIGPSDRLPVSVVGPVTAVAAIAAIGGLVPFVWSGWRRFLGLERRLRAVHARIADGLLRSLDVLRDPGARRARIVLASVALQVVAVLFHVAAARAVGVGVGTWTMFLIVPVAVVASMLPITLNGLGVREGVLVGLTVAAGAGEDAAAAFAVLALAVSLAFAAVGGIVYPFLRSPSTKEA